jgi:hypothetical protein
MSTGIMQRSRRWLVIAGLALCLALGPSLIPLIAYACQVGGAGCG